MLLHPSGGPSSLAIDSGGWIPGTLPLIRFDPTCVMAPKTLITSTPTSVTLVTPAPMAFVPSATFSPTQLGSPTRHKAPLKLSPSPLTRLSKSSVTTVLSFPVLFSRYTDNSTLLTVCHFVNKFSTIS